MSYLRFYTSPMSRGRIVRWMLEEVGCDYDTHLVVFDDPRPEVLLAANPLGKVPTLIHGDRVVTEAAAICAYLADAFPEAGLAPPLAERADYYRWLFFAASTLEYAVMHKGLGLQMPEGRERQIGYGNYARVMDALEQAVAGKGFVAGDSFSAADVYLGSQIGWGLQFGTIEPRPAFAAYWAGLKDRPAKRRADQIDDALMPEGPAA
ncbi:glutathione S-transferase family protein [Maribius pontilimi]|uniref:Glutathione S-transferase family protein n=1 Tax=Palleronia pontilimi TaxID=1964209 RepID=A0A934MCG4_9RHOB|nr:glutathione S-transferase family protein [Palleronia pontilimi]MBJ3762480.1 glutathione S-transferase family protein [Palleronia pontilimi]